MSDTESYDVFSENVGYRKADDVAIVKLGSSIYSDMTNLDSRDEFFSLMDAVDGDDSVGAMLTINDEGSFDETAYTNLLASIAGQSADLTELDSSPGFKRKSSRSRQLYFLRYHLMRRLESTKLVIDGLQGTVTTPFLGESLSADFRFATPDTVFSLCHVRHGLHPTAALVFFLPRFIGHGRSIELMLKGGEIGAQEALEAGLVNEIFPKEDFENRCIEATKNLCKTGAARVGARSMLYAPLRSGLESCFETEASLYLSNRW